MFQAHINVEYCNSLKSIEYIYKDINKGSDMAVVKINNATAGDNNVIARYQMGDTLTVMQQFGESCASSFMTGTQLSFILEYTEKTANVFISLLIMLTKELLNRQIQH
ncbi:hypothetical protein AVEN_194351-1 [Araneus ventricosus]|uniref:Uncharacterized protein n=1 Tax=Araneus ventricosus TaxID=182803 RepID=A0A4Y2L5J6_ARAVE|nr:hypothetical protein AVEN_194351-1 [Araneus ventricosus]